MGRVGAIFSLFRWGEDPNTAAINPTELASSLLGHNQNSVTGHRMVGVAKSRLGDFNAFEPYKRI